MPRRDFRSPPSLPEETQTRCITIPASQPWLGLVNAALLMLTEAWRYEQVEETDLTAEATAARAYQMYVEYLGECSMACCPLRINPFNGRLQQSDDGGLSWFDVEDGPWTESLYPPFSAMPAPRPETTDAEKLCAASATAAYVLANLYQQTGNTLLNAVADTDWEYAGALGAMLQGFLMMIGAAAVQPFVAIASLLGVVGVKQQYVDNPLDAADEEQLTCILLENATLEASGAVTFNFQATWDAIDLDSPKNGLVRFLLTMIGPDALNYAGAIDAGITPDCSECGTWCYEWDMTATDGAFTVVTDRSSSYVSGQGWSGGNWSLNETPFCTLRWRNSINIRRTFDPTVLTYVEMEFSGDNGTIDNAAAINNQINLFDGATQVVNYVVNESFGAGIVQSWTGEESVDSLELQLSVGTRCNTNVGIASANFRLQRVLVRGIGTNPFGEDNC